MLGFVVAATVLLAIVAAVVAARREPPTLDLDTPDGVVQAFLRAVLEGDDESAAALLSPSTGCDATDIANAFVTDSARILLVESDEDGDDATVTVEITESSGSGPFEGSEFSHEETFSLADEDGSWLIVGEPWPLYFCDRG